MTPEQLAARWLAGVPKWATFHDNMMFEKSVIAAIARHLAPVDDLVEAERPADTMRKMAEMLPMGSAIRIAAFASADTITALLARIAALTATVAGLQDGKAFWENRENEAVKRAETAEAETATLRDRLARIEGALERVGQARLLLDTGAVSMSETMDYAPATIMHILNDLDAALTDGGSNG